MEDRPFPAEGGGGRDDPRRRRRHLRSGDGRHPRHLRPGHGQYQIRGPLQERLCRAPPRARRGALLRGRGRHGLGGSLVANGGAPFLRELLAAWRRHTAAVSVIQDILMYMDRTFVPATGRTPVRALGLGLWRDGVVRSEKVRPMLVEAVRLERGREQAAEPGAGDLVAGVTEMLSELGAEVCREFMDAPTASS